MRSLFSVAVGLGAFPVLKLVLCREGRIDIDKTDFSLYLPPYDRISVFADCLQKLKIVAEDDHIPPAVLRVETAIRGFLLSENAFHLQRDGKGAVLVGQEIFFSHFTCVGQFVFFLKSRKQIVFHVFRYRLVVLNQMDEIFLLFPVEHRCPFLLLPVSCFSLLSAFFAQQRMRVPGTFCVACMDAPARLRTVFDSRTGRRCGKEYNT